MNMLLTILASVTDAATQPAQDGSALAPALKISGVALLGIFVVMGIFAASIVIMGRLFPGQQPE